MTVSAAIETMFDLSGKVALVTGSTRGLGLVFASTLASCGASVAVCSRTRGEAHRAGHKLSDETGARVIGITADVSRSADVNRLVGRVEDQLGPVDILVANAGINYRLETAKLGEKDWDRVIATNLKGGFLLGKRVVPGMRRRKWGRIVFVSSMLAFVSLPGRAPYSASKAGLLGLTRALALETAADGICVNALCPGPFLTPMNLALSEDRKKNRDFISKLPVGRWGRPEELRGIILYLCSRGCSFTTGASVVVDGGWTVQ